MRCPFRVLTPGNLPLTTLRAARHRWLSDPSAFSPLPSGGDHAAPWPPQAAEFAREFLPHCRPLNFALLADELARRFGFHHSRAAVAAWCRVHLPELAAPTRLKSLTIILHPERQFRVIPHPPAPPAFAWPTVLAHYSL